MEPNVELPGVHLLEVDESVEIPGVYTDQKPKLPEPNVDIGIDFNSPAPHELPLVKVEHIQANDVVHRSTRAYQTSLLPTYHDRSEIFICNYPIG